MDLEKIEGVRINIKKLESMEIDKDISIGNALNFLSNIRDKYKEVLKENGEEYCNENCSDIPESIKNLIKKLENYHF
jgi:hypothetical protein